jgi:hypothetical protein
VCSNTIPVRTMLDLTALSIVFLIVTLAVPYTTASTVSGTVGLALSHAFEAAYIAQTVVRPITSALQTGLSTVSQVARTGTENAREGLGWAGALDFHRRTQQLGSFSPNSGPSAPGPKGIRTTSTLSSSAQNTTSINAATARPVGGANLSSAAKATRRI